MKKVMALIAAAALAAAAVSCSGKKTDSKSEVSATEATQEATTLQPVPTDHSEVTTSAAATTTASAATTTSAVTTQQQATQADPMGGGIFEYNDDGAVVFEQPISETDDKSLIAAAQALYESAGHVHMNFTVGCPFKVDYDTFVENDLGWQFYRITESGITTIKDVEDAYYKVFSRRYPCSELSELYIEKLGSVYALCGNRGSNIYYSSSRVTGIKTRSDDEIVFTVDSYYDGSDFGDESYTQTDEFSVVIEDGNVWKAGRFVLPY